MTDVIPAAEPKPGVAPCVQKDEQALDAESGLLANGTSTPVSKHAKDETKNGHRPQAEKQHVQDDSGVDLVPAQTNDCVTTGEIVENDGDDDVSTVHATKGGYKSPELVIEELPEDVYSIIQVRDAVESLDSDALHRSTAVKLLSSETYGISPQSPTESHCTTSSELTLDRRLAALRRDVSDFGDDDQEVIRDNYAEETQIAYEKENAHATRDVYSEATSDNAWSEQGSVTDANEDLQPAEWSESEIESVQQLNAADTLPKRGKKRAQEDDNGPLLIREVEDKVISEEETYNALVLQNFHTTRARKVSLRRPPSTTWLHPVFQVNDEDLTPKPLRHHIELLRHAIQEVPHDFQIYKRLFSNVLGPVICHNREMQIFETVNAVLTTFGDMSDSLQNATHQQVANSAARQLLCEDHFIYRYLSSFQSYSAFLESNTLLQNVCSSVIMREMHSRMTEYLGMRSETGYEYWAVARAQRLHKANNRPLTPDDLNEEARKEWLERLDFCSTVQETVDVTELYFGPLRPISGFPTPHVDILRYWNACECGICQRSRKRARVERQSEEENDGGGGGENTEYENLETIEIVSP